MPTKPLRVTFFLDGYTLKKVNEYYKKHHRFQSSVHLKGLKTWVSNHVNKVFVGDKNLQIEMDCHYYHPHRNPHIYGSGSLGVLNFERELQAAGYKVHYSNKLEDNGTLGPNLELIEDALLIASYKKMDLVVLLSTQGQFAPLPDRLRMMGIPTMVLGWDLVYLKGERSVHWKTDYCLKDICAHYVPMEKIMDNGPEVTQPPKDFFFKRK